jgi:RNA polymerase sigma-70 factor (ECF subfamily)
MLTPLTGDDLSRLYDRHAEAMLAFFVRRTSAPDAAVDLLAETFAAAFHDRRQFRGGDDRAAGAWLFAIVRHQLADYFRRGRVERRALARLGVERRPLTDAEYDRIEELAASRELRQTVAGALAALPSDQEGRHRWVRDTRFGPGEFSEIHARVASTVLEVDVLGLPAEPGALEAALRDHLAAAARDDDPETGFHGGERPADWQVLTVVEQSLDHPLASPEQRSALYEVAARLDGVQAVEGVEDPVGRPATVLRLRHRGMLTEVYFDPDTSATLAKRLTYGGGGAADTRVYTPPTAVPDLGRRCRGQRCSGLG